MADLKELLAESSLNENVTDAFGEECKDACMRTNVERYIGRHCGFQAFFLESFLK